MEYFFNFDKMRYLTGERPEGCILCLVSAADPRVPDLSVHATDSFIVTVNLYPYNPGHLMVFPRRHVLDLRELSEEERQEMDWIRDKTLDVLDRVYHPTGYNIGLNMGRSAGASIDHLHLHIIPRYEREIGIAELIAGKRVLVEDPRETARRVAQAFTAMA